jgi:formylglycine-generating enzyme required for sulfatase activity
VPPSRGPVAGRDWFVNGQGQTFAIVRGPIEFRFDPEVTQETEKIPLVRAGRSFALATTEVTRGQFARVLGPAALGELSGAAAKKDDDADHPANFASYYDAARFCRRLSELEGVEESQMCFPPHDQIGEGMQLPADYLERTGYRLPTEAEWMAGCFGRSRRFYHFGSDPDLAPHYARCLSNGEGRTGPVAQLKPNDLGLYDTLGNVYEWLTPFPLMADVAADSGAGLPPDDVEWALRGGSYTSAANLFGDVTYRNMQSRPDLRDASVGFRVARTCR